MSDADEIVRIVCAVEGGDRDEVLSKSKRRNPTRVRRAVAKALRDEGYSYPEIGRALGRRHHTTVMYLLGVVKKGKAAA